MKKFILTSLVLTSALTVTACGGEAKKQLGLEREAPDEFAVITRAPLAVPPDFTVRPPRPGASRPMEISTKDQARQTVFGAGGAYTTPSETTTTAIEADSDAARSILERAGADTADSNIRNELDANLGEYNSEAEVTAEKLLFWRDGDEVKGKALDPVEEMERLRAEDDVQTEKRD